MTYRVIPRSEWGASYGDGAGPAQLPATEVYVHHSVTLAPDMVLPRDDDYEAIRRLDQIGADTFGAQYGVPYTYPITPAGLVFEGHAVDQMGAHTKGHNWSARAICFVGNYEEDHLTEEQIYACAWLLQHGHAQGWWTEPRITGGHRDVYATACPGQHAYDAISRINRLAAGGPISEEDDDMSFSEVIGQRGDGSEVTAGDALANLYLGAYYGGGDAGEHAVYPTVSATYAAVQGLSQAVAALSSDSELTAERVAEIVRQAVTEHMPDQWQLTGTSSEEQTS